MYHDATITKKKNKPTKKHKSESAESDPEAVENTYGIYHLNIGEATHGSDESERLLVQRRIGRVDNKRYNYKSITYECNILSNILNPMKCTK